MAITIKKGTNSLDITFSDGTVESYQRGDPNVRPKYNFSTNRLTIVNFADQYIHPELGSVPFGSVTNGDTSSTFASLQAVKDYIDTNFFRSAGGSSGSSIQSGLMGYAMTSGTTTGGAGGTVYYVSTLDTLKSVLNDSDPTAKIVYIEGIINGNGDEAVYVGSNKTIIGTPGSVINGCSLRMFGQNNTIFKNLTFGNTQSDACIMVKSSSHHVWIDHCDFSVDRNHGWDYYGKAISMTDQSDFVTVSWCRFHDANLSVLIGNTNDVNLTYQHVTMHHNYWYNCTEREPSAWSSNVHMFNNYHLGNGDYSIASRSGSWVRTDSEYFDGAHTPIVTNIESPNGFVTIGSASTYVNSGANVITTSDPGYTVPYDFSSYLDAVANVPNLVTANAGAPRVPITPPYMKEDTLLGTIWELGGLVKAITAGVPFSLFTGNRALIDNRIEFVPVYIKDYCMLTGVKTMLQTQGVYTNDQFNGVMLYQSLLGVRTLIAYSNDTPTLWKAAVDTVITVPFQAPIAVQPGLYFIAILWNASATTTAPKIYCSVDYNAALWNGFTLANSEVLFGVKTATNTPPSPTINSSALITTTNAIPYVAVY